MDIIYHPKVRAFIVALDDAVSVRVLRVVHLLQERGHTIRMPLSKPIEDGLFELRIIGALHVRILYFFHNDTAIMVHACFKKTERLSRRDIEYALHIRSEYLANS